MKESRLEKRAGFFVVNELILKSKVSAMKRVLFLCFFASSHLIPIASDGQPLGTDDRYNVLKNPSVHYDNRVDNMLYWNYALRNGYVEAFASIVAY